MTSVTIEFSVLRESWTAFESTTPECQQLRQLFHRLRESMLLQPLPNIQAAVTSLEAGMLDDTLDILNCQWQQSSNQDDALDTLDGQGQQSAIEDLQSQTNPAETPSLLPKAYSLIRSLFSDRVNSWVRCRKSHNGHGSAGREDPGAERPAVDGSFEKAINPHTSCSIPDLINPSLQPTEQDDHSSGVEQVLGPAVQSPSFQQMASIDVFDLPASFPSPGDHHFFVPGSPSDLSSIFTS